MDSAAKEYLEKSLRYVEAHPGESNPDVLESLKRKNEIRKAIKTFFTHRDCQTLFRPVTEEAKLREVNTLPYSELRI
jgi:hypothetical protein